VADDDDEIRAVLADAPEAQWAALPREYHARSAESRRYKVVLRRDEFADARVRRWLELHGGKRIVGDAPWSPVTGEFKGQAPIFYLVPRDALAQ
jgi:hypothetical protein